MRISKSKTANLESVIDEIIKTNKYLVKPMESLAKDFEERFEINKPMILIVIYEVDLMTEFLTQFVNNLLFYNVFIFLVTEYSFQIILTNQLLISPHKSIYT